MNKKIFTLLAVACMLFLTAYNVNARSVAERSVGSLVTSIPMGVSKGMYHIQVDSIYLCGVWYPVTWDGNTGPTASPQYLAYDPATKTVGLSSTLRDTIVLAVTEHGEVIMVSANNLRDSLAFKHLTLPDRAGLADLQATLWCIEVEEPAQNSWGNWPTFHFTNRVFNMDLDYALTGTTYVSGRDKGWMYSQAHENGQLSSKQPFFRHHTLDGEYRVLVAELTGLCDPTGKLYTDDYDIQHFVTESIEGMLKFSIVKASPFVLTAEDFNTQLGNTDGSTLFKLGFDPVPKIDSPFMHYLKAFESANADAAALDYLNVQAFGDANGSDYEGFIANMNYADPDQYNNDFSIQYLNLHTRKATLVERMSDTDLDGFNYSYRFVYFPSEDSLVVNAFYVKHNGHNTFTNLSMEDRHPLNPYRSDFGGNPYFYGLYNDSIHTHLIVRLQDLSSLSGPTSMITIGEHPGNVRLYFGINSCKEMWLDVWQPSPGVYTIWDQRGYALGIRMYNGTYTPQWIKLEDDIECPDRIPSYQWVVEFADRGMSNTRINITNREFGHFTIYAPHFASEIVQMTNVIVRRGYHQIFNSQSQFLYSPLVPKPGFGGTYEPITKGWVKGEYLTPLIENGNINIDAPTECGTGGVWDYSGFRPVINAYLGQETLGYKHFHVGKNPLNPDYGKSEDRGNEKGMDFNAFTFNYLNGYDKTDKTYIHLGERYDEQLLQAAYDQRTGFQFMLGQELRYDQYREELFGYPVFDLEDWTNLHIIDRWDKDRLVYIQHKVPRLMRYYYELKIADYYNFRDGLAKQYVVLKGAETDHSSIKNSMIYGLADIWALREPFKFANVYLRETYFIKKDKRPGEERNIADDTRRIYYAILDRIELEQISLITELGPYEVSDVLYTGDGSMPYSLVAWDVDFNLKWVKAEGKVASGINIATFALDNYNYPLYRRLRSMRDDTANDEGDGMDPELGAQLGTNLDAPKTLRIVSARSNQADFLYEDGMSSASEGRLDNAGNQINFLGITNKFDDAEVLAPDGTVKFNYHMFIDTAFINRGTGPIKPQYLFAVDQTIVSEKYINDYGLCDALTQVPLQPYIIGRYLVNATDSARAPGSNGDAKAPQRNDGYEGKWFLWDTDWDRLAFVPAIHIHDRLYIISEVNKRLIARGVNPRAYWVQSDDDGEMYVNGDALYAMTLPGGPLYGTERLWTVSDRLGTYYDFGDWDNYHNDVCFSLRFTHPNVENPNAFGIDVSSNYDKRFFIESETNDRSPYGNPKIAPVQGGWIMIQNRVPVLSRTSYQDAINQAEIFNIAEPPVTGWQDGIATQNENANTAVSVVAGDGFVTIFNADGKQVKIANMLGQTVVNKVLAGNKETVAAPAGIAVVTVEGEKAVKVIIK